MNVKFRIEKIERRKKFISRFKKKKLNENYHPKIGKIIPSAVTVVALCIGLTAIYFGLSRNWEAATVCVLAAGLLDGIDGRLARLLKSSSDFGAELDSLADLVNFGVAPGVLVYLASLHQFGRSGWACCLFFSACCALRLARFNAYKKFPDNRAATFSVGVPAPGGAVIAILPFMFEFSFSSRQTGLLQSPDLLCAPAYVCAFCVILSAVLMISKIPTFVFKKISIDHSHIWLFLVSMIAITASLIAAPWESALSLAVAYVASIPISCFSFYKKYGKLYFDNVNHMLTKPGGKFS
ncbi:CDP-alcohol phosphatidyltransferase family protein [Candidatus Hydrogenosomobacter endosymbioticus]|uniref:CDP-diacylglycerol--serine O-phosphatidyltransferase n=1 Tax=Candidatus Hydrogenosomobacter endosymbioticus TaxID=2558174 RepID=A0ABN6L7C5_9PROT|nr:phosphatidylcholine/phosphatidylserine synthase [Candidatus Hydrogenosomobacter endosymbioticus]BDB96045.1 CDP-diacylglycerol--serine O-phosphatidyltransferase [Candidatus Hydrogenosomobacter endosymbioticus]